MGDAWPRQPRRGNPENRARVARHGGHPVHFGVECRRTNGSWFEVAQFKGETSAVTMKQNLNSIFERPAADLDFITPTSFPGGRYAVIWPGVAWDRDHKIKTKVGDCPKGSAVTFEDLYKSNHIQVIHKVKAEDQKWYDLPAWRLAFQWANNIRSAVNGWNCTKDVRGYPLIASGTIPLLKHADARSFDPIREEATVYGYGECQPNFQVANGEIFHTLDLGIAVPGPRHDQKRWQLNQWVKVTYNKTGKSVHARLIDVCGCNHVDLSRGVAEALGFGYGTGHVIVGEP